MNEPVVNMIDKLHARLDDLAEVVNQIPFELNGYDKKLDRIDDQVYLIEVELEKKLNSAVPLTPVNAQQSEAFDAAASESDAGADKKGANAASGGADGEGGTHAQAEGVEHKKEDAEEGKQEGFLTDSAKETIAGATKTLNSLYKDGKEVVGEFSEAFGDIKEVFGKKSIFKKR